MILEARQRQAEAALRIRARAERDAKMLELRQKSLTLSLAEFVEETSGVELDAWQVHLCERLQKLRYQKGQRLLIHAPPQMGKSIIVSQRLTPYLLGHIPTLRSKLACYNIDRAKKHTKLARDIMTSPEYAQIFEEQGGSLFVERTAPEKEWSTKARIDRRDGQSSYMALGLVTGFVGEGADLLIIDDPYASPDQARSKLENKKICDFYPEVANVRITEESNVVVMFHRYTENDIAGTLLATGEWEYLRYAAEADGEYECPVSKKKYKDPMDRPDGQRLSERRSDFWYKQQKANSYVWLSQFQGRPTNKEGNLFLVSKIVTVDAVPPGLKACRSWDLASTPDGGDYTVGWKTWGPDEYGYFYVDDVQRGQWGVEVRDAVILETAERDGKRCQITLPKEPGHHAKDLMLKFQKMLAGYALTFRPTDRDKEGRAENFIKAVNLGAYRFLKAAWVADAKDELRAFPNGTFDDQVDAGGDAHNQLNHKKVGKSA